MRHGGAALEAALGRVALSRGGPSGLVSLERVWEFGYLHVCDSQRAHRQQHEPDGGGPEGQSRPLIPVADDLVCGALAGRCRDRIGAGDLVCQESRVSGPASRKIVHPS